MIRILTDSASDILPAEAEQLGVTVIPLNVTLEDGTVLRDGVDMTPTVYYGVMARCHKLPTTSQPSPELFQRFFLEAAAAGDEVVGIFLSHELSGTCQCARLAADMANVDNVLFVDSENVCLGESLLVRLAVQLRDAGAYVALFKKIEELGGISTCADALAGYTLAPREVQPIQTYLQENLGRNEALVRQIGCVIGTHAGPGAFGLAFLDEGFTF